MGEVLGVGLSHFPGFARLDSEMSFRFRQALKSPRVPEHLKEPSSWPEAMQLEWGTDQGVTFAARHRRQFAEGVRKIRQAIDDFKPDAVILFGDDQYENFQEVMVPPFCTFIAPCFELRPFLYLRGEDCEENSWGEPPETTFTADGQPEVARFLVKAAMAAEFDMSYSYQVREPEGEGLGHAFNFTIAYLDWDRRGWPYPIVPIAVNAYGSGIIRNRGINRHLFEETPREADPPAPSPKRCFDLGGALARALKASDWRVVIVGSSSWSHAFLTEKNHFLYPDVPTDRRRFEALRSCDYLAWRGIPLGDLEEAGEHELLNWMPLAGAMHELGQKPSYCEFLETYLMNSCKVNAIFPPLPMSS